MTDDRGSATIADFGEQWTLYPDNDGYYGSVSLLQDVFGPLLQTEALHKATVVDIGSGTGRIVRMLFDAGASSVTAVEPSDAFDVLKRNTQDLAARIEYVHNTGDRIPTRHTYDFAMAIGVLHHIPDPLSVARAAFDSLRPGGQFVAWLYGREGNEAYLRIALPLRRVTTRLPHSVLSMLCHALNSMLSAYIGMCRYARLPLRRYIHGYLSLLTRRQRYLAIYDQLNPSVAEYYTAERARGLFAAAGFSDIRLHHRYGYSWTVIGTKCRSRAAQEVFLS